MLNKSSSLLKITILIVLIVVLKVVPPVFSSELKKLSFTKYYRIQLHDIETAGHINSLSLSSTDEELALGTDKGIYIYNFTKGSIVKSYLFINGVSKLKYSNTGKFLGFLSGQEYGFLNQETNKIIRFPDKDILPDSYKSIFFSSKDKIIFIDPTLKGIKAISTESRKTLFHLNNSYILNDLIYSDKPGVDECLSLFHCCFFKYEKDTGKQMNRIDYITSSLNIKPIRMRMICSDGENGIHFFKNQVMKISLTGDKVLKSIRIKEVGSFCPPVVWDRLRQRIGFLGICYSKVSGKSDFYFYVLSTNSLNPLIHPVKLPGDVPLCMSPSGKFVVFADKGKLYRIDLEKKGVKK